MKGSSRINPKSSAVCLGAWEEGGSPRGSPRKHGESVQTAIRRRLQGPNLGPPCTEVTSSYRNVRYKLKHGGSSNSVHHFLHVCYHMCIFWLYKTLYDLPCRCLILCVFVSTLHMLLFMEVCLKRAVPSSSAQSSELWGDWWVIRGWLLRLIIRCFYGELPICTKISVRSGKHQDSSGPQQADLTAAFVVTLINNHDQCFWWMRLNLYVMTGGVWVRRRRGDWLLRQGGQAWNELFCSTASPHSSFQ